MKDKLFSAFKFVIAASLLCVGLSLIFQSMFNVNDELWTISFVTGFLAALSIRALPRKEKL